MKGKVLDICELGDPVLRLPATEVIDVFAPEVESLIEDMLATVSAANGVGLAAPQVGVSSRIFILAPEPQQNYPNITVEDTLVVINPKLTLLRTASAPDWEGCLSIPGIRGLVNRAESVEMTYINRLGEPRKETFSGFIARIIQHEYDHLEGVVFLDKLDSVNDIITDKEYIKLCEERS